MKKYVVTGGAGFIGSALVRGLLNLGDASVQVIDNLSTGHKENLDESPRGSLSTNSISVTSTRSLT